MNPYDLVPYTSRVFEEMHPLRLELIARIYGMSPVSREKGRVLELGCGRGASLIAYAKDFPQTNFVGIDYSTTQIKEAKEVAKERALPNICFEAQDLKCFETEETFDFILCHGVFSWVSPEIQERIFQIIRHALALNGVAYVSYNVLPGWEEKFELRKELLAASQASADPHHRLNRALERLDKLSRSSSYLSRLALDVLQSDPRYIYHEFLEEFNEPLHFLDFLERAEPHGLTYLEDAGFTARYHPRRFYPLLFGESFEDLLNLEISYDRRGKNLFRRSLLVREEAKKTIVPNPSLIAETLDTPSDALAQERALHESAAKLLFNKVKLTYDGEASKNKHCPFVQ